MDEIDRMSAMALGKDLRDDRHRWWLRSQRIVLEGKAYDPYNFAENDPHPLMTHPFLWRCKRIHQLGQIFYVSCGSAQDRYVHQLDSAAITSKVLANLEHISGKTLDDLHDAVVVHALIHDWGHGPYSHASEDFLKALTGKDHKQRGVELIDTADRDDVTFAEQLEKHGIDPQTVRLLMQGKHPASKIVADKTIGTEKIAYLIRDRENHHRYSRVPDPDTILGNTLYWNEQYGLMLGNELEIGRDSDHEDVVQLAVDLQNFYAHMYAQFYLSPKSLLLTRHVQRALQHLVDAGTDPHSIWTMGDSELETAARKLGGEGEFEIEKLQYGALTPSRIAVKFEGYTRPQYKDEKVVQVSGEEAARLEGAYTSPQKVHALEDYFTKAWGTRVYLTACPTPERFKPHTVMIHDVDGWKPIYEHDPDFALGQRQIQRKHWAIRVHSEEPLPKNAEQEFLETIVANAI